MVLDFLPWEKPRQGRLRYWGIMRYLHFFVSLAIVLLLWNVYQMRDFHEHSRVELNWLIMGNLAYFSIAIGLAAILKDNRAFCKYVCPIPVFMKPGARFSIWKIEIDREKCSECGVCEENCPMNIQLLEYMKQGKRVCSTECIACQQCVNSCPLEIIQYSKKYDYDFREYLNFRRSIE